VGHKLQTPPSFFPEAWCPPWQQLPAQSAVKSAAHPTQILLSQFNPLVFLLAFAAFPLLTCHMVVCQLLGECQQPFSPIIPIWSSSPSQLSGANCRKTVQSVASTKAVRAAWYLPDCAVGWDYNCAQACGYVWVCGHFMFASHKREASRCDLAQFA